MSPPLPARSGGRPAAEPMRTVTPAFPARGEPRLFAEGGRRRRPERPSQMKNTDRGYCKTAGAFATNTANAPACCFFGKSPAFPLPPFDAGRIHGRFASVSEMTCQMSGVSNPLRQEAMPAKSYFRTSSARARMDVASSIHTLIFVRSSSAYST